MKENCLNSRTSDVDIKVGPVTKLHKGDKTAPTHFDDDVIWKNCEVIAIFLIYGQFGAIFDQ